MAQIKRGIKTFIKLIYILELDYNFFDILSNHLFQLLYYNMI